MPQGMDPIVELTDMARAVSRLLGEPAGSVGRHAIAVDLIESRDALEFTAYLPGIRREDVTVELVGGVLVLRAERARPAVSEGQRVYVESPFGRFERRVAVGSGVRSEGAQATWRDGALTVRLPKVDRSQTIAIADAGEAAPSLPQPESQG
jgi:HSP20 family protein